MKQLITFIITLAMFFSTSAQQFTPNVMANGGGKLNNDNVKLSYTIGEAVTGLISNNSVIFSEGFQQSSAGITVSVTEKTTPSVEIHVFPNPSKDLINVSFQNTNSEEILIQLFDINGVMLSEIKNSNQSVNNQISLAGLPSQTYFLKIITVSGEQKGTYKIQKLN